MAETISKALLRTFVPLSELSEQQLDLLQSQIKPMYLFKGQTLDWQQEAKPQYIFLTSGQLKIVSEQGEMVWEAGTPESSRSLTCRLPTTASVVAETDSNVFSIDFDFLEKLLCWGQVARCLLADIALKDGDEQNYQWVKKLLQSKLFHKVPPINIRKVLDKFSRQATKKGQVLIQQGEEGRCCYLLKEGSAEVLVDGEPVAILEAGAVFGEDALVNKQPRNASVVMLEDGAVLALEKQDFYQLLAPSPVSMAAQDTIQGLLDAGAIFLDVRTEQEFDLGHLQGALNIPLNLVGLKSRLLNRNQLYVCYSATEERAKAAAYLLAQQGFRTYALQKGIASLPKELASLFVST